MRYLIVNADDFGASRGTSRGIIDAHRRGIVTSTSLLVNTPWSEAAAALSMTVRSLSVGLHVDLDHLSDADPQAELHRQVRRFQELIGSPPTHLDCHHNAQRDPRLLPPLLQLARQYGVPLREHSPARYCSKFYGQWGGETHLEQIGADNLARLLETEVQDGVTELSCHPGYVDPDLRSSYGVEREAELRALCDPTVPAVLAAHDIQLVGFRDLAGLLASNPA